jgi:hypothetical protein
MGPARETPGAVTNLLLAFALMIAGALFTGLPISLRIIWLCS